MSGRNIPRNKYNKRTRGPNQPESTPPGKFHRTTHGTNTARGSHKTPFNCNKNKDTLKETIENTRKKLKKIVPPPPTMDASSIEPAPLGSGIKVNEILGSPPHLMN